MAFSRRGILFTPGKKRRLEDYFSLPVTIPRETQRYQKLIEFGNEIYKTLKDFLIHLFCPEVKINIPPCVCLPTDYSKNTIAEVPFYEDTRRAVPKRAKKPPPDIPNSAVLKKNCKSHACQTDLLLALSDFNPSFGFAKVKQPGHWHQREDSDTSKTDISSDKSEEVVERKVLKKVVRRLSIANCEPISVMASWLKRSLGSRQEFGESFNKNEENQLMPVPGIMEINENLKSSQFDRQGFRLSQPSATEFTENFTALETKILEIEPISCLPQVSQALCNESQAMNIVNIPEVNSEIFSEDCKTAKKQSVFQQEKAEENPFLNINIVKSADFQMPFTFGNAFSETCTTPKVCSSVHAPLSNSKAENFDSKDIEMTICTPPSNIFQQAPMPSTIQTPNILDSHLFTQKNPVELYQVPPLFQMPSFSQSSVVHGLFSNCSSNMSTPQSKSFNLGKISSSKKKP